MANRAGVDQAGFLGNSQNQDIILSYRGGPHLHEGDPKYGKIGPPWPSSSGPQNFMTPALGHNIAQTQIVHMLVTLLGLPSTYLYSLSCLCYTMVTTAVQRILIQ